MLMVLINRDQLAQQLRCSLPTVDAMIKRWPDFPVVERGGLGRAWKFDAAAVVNFLQDKRDEEERAQAEKSELLAQLVLPIERRDHDGKKLDLDDELKAVKLRKALREEQIESQFLVQTHEVRAALERSLRRFGQSLDSAVERVVKTHNLPDAVKRALVLEFGEARTAFVNDAAEFLSKPEENDEQFALRA